MHIELCHHCFRSWLVACSAPSHHLNQCWYIDIWTPGNIFQWNSYKNTILNHWGRVMYICVGKLTIIASDNDLSPGRRQAIIWTNTGILLIGPLGTNFNEILIEIQTFSLMKIRLKMLSAKCCPFRLGLNVLILIQENAFANVISVSLSMMIPALWCDHLQMAYVSCSVCCPCEHWTGKLCHW